jgi:peptidyl-prolyl cis-trans isomerase C
MPLEQRPHFDDYDSLATVIFRMKTQSFLVTEASQAGIENDPEFKRKMRLFKELNMADFMRNDSIPKPLLPDEAQIRQYYEDHPEEFSIPAEVHVYEILLSDEIQADQLAKEIKTLAQFKEKAAEFTERPAKRKTNGDLGWIQRNYFPEVFDLAKKMPNGTMGGPIVTGSGRYSLFWVVDKKEAQLKDYLDIKASVEEMLRAEQREAAVRQFIEDRRAMTEISINEDALWGTIDVKAYPDEGDEG